MRKKIIILLFGIILLFLVGCTTGNTQNSEREYHHGTQGIEFEMHGLLDKMYEGTPFQVIVQLYNKGAYDISEAYVVMTLENDYMQISKGEQLHAFSLAGKSLLNPVGDFSLETFDVQTKKIDKTSQYHDSVVTITACYKYMTDVITEVCIDPHFYDLSPTKKACEVKDLSLGDQGAPVAITDVEVKMLPNGEEFVRPQFIIHVRNVGNGNVINFKDDGIKKVCTQQQLDYQNWNLVQLSSIAFNNQNYQFDALKKGKNNIECLPDPTDKLLRLKDNEAVIRCTVAGDGISKKEAAYLTQLYIKLDYGYIVSKSQQIHIEKQLTY